jgi:hypothetical protein
MEISKPVPVTFMMRTTGVHWLLLLTGLATTTGLVKVLANVTCCQELLIVTTPVSRGGAWASIWLACPLAERVYPWEALLEEVDPLPLEELDEVVAAGAAAVVVEEGGAALLTAAVVAVEPVAGAALETVAVVALEPVEELLGLNTTSTQ